MLKNILFMTFGKVEPRRLKIEKENCISLFLTPSPPPEIWNLEIMTAFMCSLSNLKSDRKQSLLDVEARLVK